MRAGRGRAGEEVQARRGFLVRLVPLECFGHSARNVRKRARNPAGSMAWMIAHSVRLFSRESDVAEARSRHCMQSVGRSAARQYLRAVSPPVCLSLCLAVGFLQVLKVSAPSSLSCIQRGVCHKNNKGRLWHDAAKCLSGAGA